VGRQGFSGRAAVAGVGMTSLSRASGKSVLELAVEASTAAIVDAGLTPRDVDAVLTYHLGDSVPVVYLARALGLDRIGWHNEIHGGGSQCASILGDAAMLVEAGVARTVLVYRALNGRSGPRMGQVPLRVGDGAESQFTLPYGMLGPVHLFALAAQRYVAESGVDLADVVLRSRAAAAGNPRALRRTPMTRDDYLASPMVASPLRRADCCQETDGACALVVTAADRAPGSPRVHAVVRGGGPGSSAMDKADDVGRIFSAYVAPALYDAAGMKPDDIDVALLYDAYSFLVPRQQEDFGLDAAVPVNPHGGLLSEGYVHGLNNVAEAVRQVRAGAGTALCTGFGGSYGSAAVLL